MTAGPAAGRRRAVGLGERAGELRAVGRRDRQLQRRRRERRAAPGERSDERRRGADSGDPRRRARVAGSTIAAMDHAARRRVRLGRGRPDRPARVPRDDAARGLRLPRRPRTAAVRAAAARRGPRASRARSASYLETQDVKLVVVACNTATSAALPQLQEELTRAGRRRDHAGGARRGAGDAQPPHRAARDGGHGRRRALRRARARARRRRVVLSRSRARGSCR